VDRLVPLLLAAATGFGGEGAGATGFFSFCTRFCKQLREGGQAGARVSSMKDSAANEKRIDDWLGRR